MSKPRKTVEIAKLKEQINAYLAHDGQHSTSERRIGAYIALEAALHDANAYKGWGLLTRPEIGQLFTEGKGWAIKDETRRFYY